MCFFAYFFRILLVFDGHIGQIQNNSLVALKVPTAKCEPESSVK